jgi:hypothetical protein
MSDINEHVPKNRESTGYTVGKGKPPAHTRFKKGQSGNPKGRHPKLPALDILLAEVLGEEKNGTTAAQKILIALYKKALKGDTKAADILLDRGYGKAKQDVNLNANINLSSRKVVFK